MQLYPPPPPYEESIRSRDIDLRGIVDASNIPPSVEVALQHTFTMSNQGIENNHIVSDTYSISQAVQCICICDSLNTILYMIRYPYFVVTSLFAIFGYAGMKTYNIYLTLLYIIYKFVYISFHCYTLSQYNQIKYSMSQNILNILLSTWCIILSIRFIRYVFKLEPDDLLCLKDGYIPSKVVYIWF